jgi:hypothetical protein
MAMPQQTGQSKRTDWFDIRRRGVWILAFFLAFVIIMAIGAAIPVNPTDAKTTTDDLQNEFKYTATVDLIFGHNFFLTLIMFIPFIGPIFGGLSSFSTGIVVADYASPSVYNVNPIMLLASLFVYPHTWLELFAYSLAMSQSVFLSIAIVRGRFRQELVRTCVIMAICVLTLLLAAVLEVIVIALR